MLSVLTFRTPDEALEKANNTPYGLSAGIWTDKGAKIFWMAQRLKAGVVWANTYNKFDRLLAVRRIQGERLRPRGRPARPVGLHGGRMSVRRTSAVRGKLVLPDIATTSRSMTGPARGERDEDDGVDPSARVSVNKAYKMFVGGAFVRSESGRYVQSQGEPVDGSADPAVVNVPRGSRKDARDAVLVAHGAGAGWAARTAYNRGQILYRLAEVMESRKDELRVSLVRGGVADAEALAEVELAIDRAVYYAGFCDKFQALLASSNPVAGPHFGFSVPEPMGVVGIVAPASPALLGLVSTVLPVVAGGNTCVVVAGIDDPPHGGRLVRVPRHERSAGGRGRTSSRVTRPRSRRTWRNTARSSRSTCGAPTPSCARWPSARARAT